MMMLDQSPAEPSPIEQFRHWSQLMGRAQQLMLEFWTRGEPGKLPADPMGLAEAWAAVATAAAADPARLIAAQAAMLEDSVKLWSAFLGGRPRESPLAGATDKRFKGEAWTSDPAFDFLRQSYMLASKHIMGSMGSLEGLDERAKAKASFYARQFVDAMSPSNFALTNPEVVAATVESRGENLMKGLERMLGDLEAGRISQTDEHAFEVGRNIAATPGKVVFENRMFQLIQYAPTTDTVYETPLVIFPPWINKYYILDLTAEKSFVRWAVAEGLTVFVVSWRNPDSSFAEIGWDDYIGDGLLAAIDTVRAALGVEAVNAIGYCVAGTTLAATLALLASKGEAAKVRTATFFTAQVDFSEAGDLNLFVDDAQIETVRAMSAEKGYLDGRYMATTFNLLRSNDLIWNYVVNNYMLGRDYVPFDLLYWNSDATNAPAKWHESYLRDCYRDNKLIEKGGTTVDGTPIDLSLVKTPSYVQAGREDHIAPAKSVYKMTRHFKGPIRFVLAGSGHIAGVVNPPSMNKYQYWTNDALPEALDDFIAGATETKGSWWPDWSAWLTPQSGPNVPPRAPGEGSLKAIEDAPGRYVKERI